MQTLEAYVAETQACQTDETLFKVFDQFCAGFGADISAYFVIAEHLRSTRAGDGLIRQTFPENWIERYIEQRFLKIDPIIQQVRREARPFHWFDVGNKFSLDARQKAFLGELREAGVQDGLAVPVFGPMGSIAYFAFASLKRPFSFDEDDEALIQFACLQTHNRYFELTNMYDGEDIKPLSPREKEVLVLVADGLSNSAIAEKLNITENTVDTMLRRVFAKLGVHNRICAVLKAIGAGVILP